MAFNKAILLTYSNKNRMSFQNYAELFSYVGVYVCEDLVEAENFTKKIDESTKFDECYDLDICADLEKDFTVLLKNDTGYTKELLETYYNYDLLQASVTLQYFCFDLPAIEKAGKLFYSAAKQLEKNCTSDMEKIKKDYPLRYAILYCKQKANLAQSLTKHFLYYSVEELIEEGLHLIKDFPDCSNIWVLIGMICEISKEHKLDAIEAFKKAVDKEWGKPYVAGILYKIANNCDGLETLARLKKDYYEAAYKTMPEYRNIYKVGLEHMKMEVWDRASCYFLECIARIELRKSYLDPLEQEYYFKTKGHLAFIYTKNQMYLKAIECANDALNLKNKIYESMDDPEGVNKMYYDIYMHSKESKLGEQKGEKCCIKDLISANLSRMSSEILYQRLATSYQNLGLDDMAEPYWRELRR